MKRIGIVGGLGPESTIDMYRIITRTYLEKTHGQYPEVIIYCLNLKNFPCLGLSTGLHDIAEWLLKAVHALQSAGADFALIAANTPHIVFNRIEKLVSIPLLSIVETTCQVAKEKGIKRTGLLGTLTTMNASYYQEVFTRSNIEIVVPNDAEKEYIHDKLVTELVNNQIVEQTRQDFLAIIKRMIDEESIDGLILGCTEIPLLLAQDEFGIPFLNTTMIHAKAAVEYSLQ